MSDVLPPTTEAFWELPLQRTPSKDNAVGDAEHLAKVMIVFGTNRIVNRLKNADIRRPVSEEIANNDPAPVVAKSEASKFSDSLIIVGRVRVGGVHHDNNGAALAGALSVQAVTITLAFADDRRS